MTTPLPTKRPVFSWNPEGTCLFGSWHNTKSKCLFDYWTVYHFYFTGFLYIIIHHQLKLQDPKDMTKLIVFLTLLHAIEEYLGNTSRISLEGVVTDYIGPKLDSRIKPHKREIDNDYLQNSIGDVLSGVIACLLIVWYWNTHKKLPYFYLWYIIPIYFMLMTKSKMLW